MPKFSSSRTCILENCKEPLWSGDEHPQCVHQCVHHRNCLDLIRLFWTPENCQLCSSLQKNKSLTDGLVRWILENRERHNLPDQDCFQPCLEAPGGQYETRPPSGRRNNAQIETPQSQSSGFTPENQMNSQIITKMMETMQDMQSKMQILYAEKEKQAQIPKNVERLRNFIQLEQVQPSLVDTFPSYSRAKDNIGTHSNFRQFTPEQVTTVDPCIENQNHLKQNHSFHNKQYIGLSIQSEDEYSQESVEDYGSEEKEIGDFPLQEYTPILDEEPSFRMSHWPEVMTIFMSAHKGYGDKALKPDPRSSPFQISKLTSDKFLKDLEKFAPRAAKKSSITFQTTKTGFNTQRIQVHSPDIPELDEFLSADKLANNLYEQLPFLKGGDGKITPTKIQRDLNLRLLTKDNLILMEVIRTQNSFISFLAEQQPEQYKKCFNSFSDFAISCAESSLSRVVQLTTEARQSIRTNKFNSQEDSRISHLLASSIIAKKLFPQTVIEEVHNQLQGRFIPLRSNREHQRQFSKVRKPKVENFPQKKFFRGTFSIPPTGQRTRESLSYRGQNRRYNKYRNNTSNSTSRFPDQELYKKPEPNRKFNEKQ